MLSRIRLDAFGLTPAAVADTLYPHADLIQELLGKEISRGEFVVSRSLEEPEDSKFAFSGRLVLHVPLDVDLSFQEADRTPPGGHVNIADGRNERFDLRPRDTTSL